MERELAEMPCSEIAYIKMAASARRMRDSCSNPVWPSQLKPTCMRAHAEDGEPGKPRQKRGSLSLLVKIF